LTTVNAAGENPMKDVYGDCVRGGLGEADGNPDEY
jgi:hypothetical protein